MTPLETRFAADMQQTGRKLEGYAAVFDQLAEVGGFRERIRQGAFTRALSGGQDILALVDHDASRLLARTRNGSLRLSEDTRGLSFSIDLPETTLGRDILTMAERGDLGGASIGFRIPRDGQRINGRDRELTAIDLAEISIVQSFPAYAGTSIAARSQPCDRTAAAMAATKARLQWA